MRLAKSEQHHFAKKRNSARLERSPYHHIDFLHFALPGAAGTVYQCPMNKKFVGYYRVSTNQQGLTGNGMTAQREVVRRFVENQNGVLEMEFSEVESGKFTDSKRPQLAAALEYAKRSKSILVIAKLDRLARNADFLGVRTDDEPGHAKSISVLIHYWWNYMIVKAAQIIPG